MTEKIINGDYTADEGGLAEVEHTDELLQNIAMLLMTQRGSFYPSKNFGSGLRSCKSPKEAYALAYAAQALCDVDGVSVKSVSAENNNYKFTLVINNEERQVVAAV